MIRRIARVGKILWQRLISRGWAESLIELITRLSDINLLYLSYRRMGILKYENSHVSGEKFVLTHVIKQNIKHPKMCFFDIGANKGNYSLELRTEYPNSTIYSFEPNPHTFKTTKSVLNSQLDHCYCLGFGSISKLQEIFTYSDSIDSEHASIYKEVLSDIHHASHIESVEIEITTLDCFCENNNIALIDFLKIDTEGNELDVLKGASRMIAEDRISIIQFEFNEMNIISRVFLKDFYSILNKFDIYRIDTERLIYLPQYDAANEIFKFQNFLAIKKCAPSI